MSFNPTADLRNRAAQRAAVGKTHAALGKKTFGILFWLPCLVVTLAVFAATANTNYAKTGGEEVYDASDTGSTRSRQLAFLTFGAMGTFLLARPAKSIGKSPCWAILLPCILMMGYVTTSALWSDDPTTTFKRSMVLACIVIGGFGLGKTWDHRSLYWSIALISGALLVASILAEIRYGTFLQLGSAYRFSGIMHPAKQAFNCGILSLACSSLFLIEKRKIFLLLIAVSLGFVLITKARTGFAAAIVALAVLWWHYLPPRAFILGVFVIGSLTVGAAGLLGITGNAVNLKSVATMGRDADNADPTKLTGRLPIWEETLRHFSEKPVLGFGYGAFWSRQRLTDFERKNGWALSHAHSGYIETLVNLGIVGFSCALMLLLIFIGRARQLSRSSSALLGRLAFAVIVLACIGSFTETSFVADGLEIILLVTCVGAMAFESPASARPNFKPPYPLRPHREALS